MASDEQSRPPSRGRAARQVLRAQGRTISFWRSPARARQALAAALAEAEALLRESAVPAPGGDRRTRRAAAQHRDGASAFPAANLALISTPGEYAVAEALKALRLGLNVMLFSDNVTLADEAFLKRYAQVQGLLVMGPDCGTAIINGTPLGFANVVRRGDIGIVAASGTGLQQVTCLIDRLGKGVSQAIGTGGHDLHAAVGGITMQHGLDALAADPATRVIVLISKPPRTGGRRAGPCAGPARGQAGGRQFPRRRSGSICGRQPHGRPRRSRMPHVAAVALANGAAADRAPWAAAESARPAAACAMRNASSAASTAAAPSATRRRCCSARCWRRCTRIRPSARRERSRMSGTAARTR